jgi:hypothetical protein
MIHQQTNSQEPKKPQVLTLKPIYDLGLRRILLGIWLVICIPTISIIFIANLFVSFWDKILYNSSPLQVEMDKPKETTTSTIISESSQADNLNVSIRVRRLSSPSKNADHYPEKKIKEESLEESTFIENNLSEEYESEFINDKYFSRPDMANYQPIDSMTSTSIKSLNSNAPVFMTVMPLPKPNKHPEFQPTLAEVTEDIQRRKLASNW